MTSPTSEFPPVNARLAFRDWSLVCWLIKEKTQQLQKTKRGQVGKQMWLMEQVRHLRVLKENNLPFVLAEMLNP